MRGPLWAWPGMRTWRTAYMLSEENWRHSVLHCDGDSSTASSGSSGHSEAATRSNPEPELVAVSWAALLSWALPDALSEACSITAVSTTDAPFSCKLEALSKRSLLTSLYHLHLGTTPVSSAHGKQHPSAAPACTVTTPCASACMFNAASTGHFEA